MQIKNFDEFQNKFQKEMTHRAVVVIFSAPRFTVVDRLLNFLRRREFFRKQERAENFPGMTRKNVGEIERSGCLHFQKIMSEPVDV